MLIFDRRAGEHEEVVRRYEWTLPRALVFSSGQFLMCCAS